MENLEAAKGEIFEIFKKYGIGGSLALTSRDHAIYCIKFPEWSLIQVEGDNVRIRLNSKDSELSNQSAHSLLSLRDMLAGQLSAIQKASETLISAVEGQGGEVTHNPVPGP